ncbi:hypothetical protein DFH08DRAFT_721914 [Mycena albidolilacea]|uniref:Uncharacterized protein n=1 Tax=Mycena albidolilacea TaxID=1033008 RepID=A0AAD6Z221_9AGAR|nr:hypothetical protein DFH08DRAFT_721914 [Mycena albidolilacea]
MIVRDVRHRWNYTHAMIKRALLLKSAINSWVIEREELAPLNLNTTEWEILEKLGNLLEVSVSLLLLCRINLSSGCLRM